MVLLKPPQTDSLWVRGGGGGYSFRASHTTDRRVSSIKKVLLQNSARSSTAPFSSHFSFLRLQCTGRLLRCRKLHVRPRPPYTRSLCGNLRTPGVLPGSQIQTNTKCGLEMWPKMPHFSFTFHHRSGKFGHFFNFKLFPINFPSIQLSFHFSHHKIWDSGYFLVRSNFVVSFYFCFFFFLPQCFLCVFSFFFFAPNPNICGDGYMMIAIPAKTLFCRPNPATRSTILFYLHSILCSRYF